MGYKAAVLGWKQKNPGRRGRRRRAETWSMSYLIAYMYSLYALPVDGIYLNNTDDILNFGEPM